LFIKRPENTSIFVVIKFSEFTHLPFVSSLSRKIFCLESLGFEPSRIWMQMGGTHEYRRGSQNLPTHTKQGFKWMTPSSIAEGRISTHRKGEGLINSSVVRWEGIWINGCVDKSFPRDCCVSYNFYIVE
jgi:hypothetical protein